MIQSTCGFDEDLNGSQNYTQAVDKRYRKMERQDRKEAFPFSFLFFFQDNLLNLKIAFHYC